MPKTDGLLLAVSGDNKFIGNRKWRHKFESLLPKEARFCYCYSHLDLMYPNDSALQRVNHLALKKQNLYAYQGRLWLLKEAADAAGVIFVHSKESALVHVKQKEVLFCRGNLKDENFKDKLDEFYDRLKSAR